MLKFHMLKFALLGGGVIALSGCGIASLPGNYTPLEKQTVQELSGANYAPEAAAARETIKTQDLFTQAAFWGREYDLNPADLEAAVNLASTVRRMGNPGRAIEIVQHTRALYPRDIDLMAEMGAAYIADNQPRPAIKIIDTALAQSPQAARLWSLKGAAFDQLEQFDAARQHYSRALQLKPNDPGTLANIGLSFALEGDPQTAEIWLKRAAADPSASPSVRQNLSLVLGLQNKFDEAERWATQDMDALGAQQNLSYLRSLRGVSQPHSSAAPARRPMPATQAAQKPAPTPNSIKPNSYKPRVYGQAAPQTSARTAPLRAQAGLRTTANPQLGRAMTVYDNSGKGGPKTASEALLATARARTSSGPARPAPHMQQQRQAQPQSQPHPQSQPLTDAPTNILGQISQNNRSKRDIAQAQQAQFAQRAQQAQMQRYRAQNPQANPQGSYQQPYYGPQPQYGAPPPYLAPGQAAPQARQPYPVTRPPARERRR